MKILIIIASLIILMVLFHILTKKYINPYKLVMIFGKKGSGKSTLLTKIALEHLKAGREVYTNVDIPFCHRIKDEDIGIYNIPAESVLLIDEVGMIWDNRDFKKFRTEVRDWFKLQRHYKVRVYLFSQTFDIDKKLRDLTDEMYMVEKKLRVFSYAKRILKKITLIEATGESASRIDENLAFDSLFMFWAGSRKMTYIPKYTKYFDSFNIKQLPDKDYDYIESENKAYKSLKRKIKRAGVGRSILERLNG